MRKLRHREGNKAQNNKVQISTYKINLSTRDVMYNMTNISVYL